MTQKQVASSCYEVDRMLSQLQWIQLSITSSTLKHSVTV